MPKTHTCGVPACKNKGTLCLPPIGPLRDDWYRLLQLSTNSQSHRICGIHFDPCDLGKSGKKKRRDVKPTRNLPLNQNFVKNLLVVLKYGKNHQELLLHSSPLVHL